MTPSGDAWLWIAESPRNPAQPPVYGLFHRPPSGRFTFDAAATTALGPGLLQPSAATGGGLRLHADAVGRVFGVLVAPAQTPKSVRITKTDGTSAVIETWVKRTVPADAASAFPPPSGVPFRLVLADADAPDSLWAVLGSGGPSNTGRFPVLLGRFAGAHWSFPKTGFDALDLTGAFAGGTSASVVPTKLFVDGGGVWIGGLLTLRETSTTLSTGQIVARYDEAAGGVTASWCNLAPLESRDCEQPLDGTHQAAVPDVAFGDGAERVALALPPQAQAVRIYRGGAWTSVPAPGYTGLGGFTSAAEGWLVGAWGAGRWSDAPLPRPLVTWPQPNRSPLTSVAVPPGSSVAPTATGALAVGLDGTALHYAPGIGWLVDPLPPRESHVNLLGVAYTGPDAAVAVGQFGAIVRWDGTTWSEDPQSISMTQWPLNAVAADAATGEAWAVGRFGTILHFDGPPHPHPFPATSGSSAASRTAASSRPGAPCCSSATERARPSNTRRSPSRESRSPSRRPAARPDAYARSSRSRRRRSAPSRFSRAATSPTSLRATASCCARPTAAVGRI
jgi:hypothetical protein